jgi:hypothetical protein
VHTLEATFSDESGSVTVSSTFEIVDVGASRSPIKISLFCWATAWVSHRTAARLVRYGSTAGDPNGYLAMDQRACIPPTGQSVYPRVEYLSEYLHRTQGSVLGIVSTADLEDATPAANVVHTGNRNAGTARVLLEVAGVGLPTGTFGSGRADATDYAAKDIVAGWGVPDLRILTPRVGAAQFVGCSGIRMCSSRYCAPRSADIERGRSAPVRRRTLTSESSDEAVKSEACGGYDEQKLDTLGQRLGGVGRGALGQGRHTASLKLAEGEAGHGQVCAFYVLGSWGAGMCVARSSGSGGGLDDLAISSPAFAPHEAIPPGAHSRWRKYLTAAALDRVAGTGHCACSDHA